MIAVEVHGAVLTACAGRPGSLTTHLRGQTSSKMSEHVVCVFLFCMPYKMVMEMCCQRHFASCDIGFALQGITFWFTMFSDFHLSCVSSRLYVCSTPNSQIFVFSL